MVLPSARNSKEKGSEIVAALCLEALGTGYFIEMSIQLAAPSWRRFLAHLAILHFSCATLSCMSFVFSIVLCKSATNVSHCFALQWLAPA